MNRIVLAISLVLLLGGAARAQEVAAVGTAAPDFTLPDHEGKDVHLADFKGKRVVLWFFPKADTPGWTKEGCGFRDLHSEFEKKGVVVIGVSRDTVEANAAFAKKYKFPFKLLSDVDGKVTKKYGAVMAKYKDFARRNTYVIGADGKLEKVLVDVNPTTHPKELLEALKP